MNTPLVRRFEDLDEYEQELCLSEDPVDHTALSMRLWMKDLGADPDGDWWVTRHSQEGEFVADEKMVLVTAAAAADGAAAIRAIGDGHAVGLSTDDGWEEMANALTPKSKGGPGTATVFKGEVLQVYDSVNNELVSVELDGVPVVSLTKVTRHPAEELGSLAERAHYAQQTVSQLRHENERLRDALLGKDKEVIEALDDALAEARRRYTVPHPEKLLGALARVLGLKVKK